jgi:hypothetical protein
VSFVVVDPDVEGLGVMLADLVRGNIEATPDRARLLQGLKGRINVHVPDAEVDVGLEFMGGQMLVRSRPFPRADLDITTDAETLMGMSTVPLRFGMPDASKADGRAVVGKMLRGQLKVRGMVTKPKLLTRLQRLLSVA